MSQGFRDIFIIQNPVVQQGPPRRAFTIPSWSSCQHSLRNLMGLSKKRFRRISVCCSSYAMLCCHFLFLPDVSCSHFFHFAMIRCNVPASSPGHRASGSRQPLVQCSVALSVNFQKVGGPIYQVCLRCHLDIYNRRQEIKLTTPLNCNNLSFFLPGCHPPSFW